MPGAQCSLRSCPGRAARLDSHSRPRRLAGCGQKLRREPADAGGQKARCRSPVFRPKGQKPGRPRPCSASRRPRWRYVIGCVLASLRAGLRKIPSFSTLIRYCGLIARPGQLAWIEKLEKERGKARRRKGKRRCPVRHVRRQAAGSSGARHAAPTPGAVTARPSGWLGRDLPSIACRGRPMVARLWPVTGFTSRGSQKLAQSAHALARRSAGLP